MMGRRLLILVLAVVVGVCVFAVACGEEEAVETTAGATSSSTAASSDGAENVLKIASVANLSTPQGLEIQKWLDLFAKIYDEQGGWDIGGTKYRLEPTVYDCGMADTTKSRAANEKAVLQDGVKFIVCTWLDIPSVAVSITEPNKVLWMGTDFTDSTLSPDFNYTVRGQGLFFGSGAAYTMQKDMYELGARTELVVDPDTEQAKTGNALWASSAELLGMEIMDPLSFPTDTTDFGPIATKIKSLDPDFLEMPYFGSGEQIVNLVAALKDVGYDGLIYPGNVDPTVVENLVTRVGKEYIEGMECVYFDPMGIMEDPTMLSLMDRYVEEYGEWHTEGIFWLGPWFLFQDAVNTAQSIDVDKVAEVVQNMDHGVHTLCGYTQLFARPDKDILKTVDSAPGHYIAVIQDGQMVPLRTVTVKDQYLVTIKVQGLADTYKAYWEEYGRPTFPDEESVFDFADLDN